MFVDTPTYIQSDCGHRPGSGRRDCNELKPGDIIHFPIEGQGKSPCQITYIQYTPILPGFWIEVVLPGGTLQGRWFRSTEVPEVVG